MLASIIQARDIFHFLNIISAILVSLAFGLERSYRGKVKAVSVYSLVTLVFSGITIGMQYIHQSVDPLVVGLLFLALVFVVFLVHLWKKENMDDFSCASLLMSGTLAILICLNKYLLSLFLLVLVIIIYTLVYLLNIYIERRRYALTILVNKEENILLKVLDLCDKNGAKIKYFNSSVVLVEDNDALKLEVVFSYGTSKVKVKKVFEELKEIKPLNLVYHGDIHKMEWK